LEFFRKYSVPRWMIFLHDNLAVFITFFVAYILRFNFDIHGFDKVFAIEHALVTLCIYCIFSLVFRPYSGMIRHTTIIDIYYVFLTTTLSCIVLVVVSLLSRSAGWPHYLVIPISILIIHYVLVTVYMFAVRLTIKTLYHFTASLHIKKNNVLIYGAGSMGVIVKRVIQSDVKGNYQIVGFLDRNKKLQGKKVTGIPVYNPNIIHTDFLRKRSIETLIFAIKDILPSEKGDIIRSALDVGLEVRDTPPIESWLDGHLEMRQIEKVQLEDLLGRDPIVLNLEKIGKGLKGKTILVTGAAGSIGSEIVRQLTRFNIKELVLVDHAETPMFHLENELKAKDYPFSIHMILADVTDSVRMENIFQEFYPEIVFHAAAYKHVPLMENNPNEAFRVNVGSTKNITKLSIRFGVKKFVMISSDKAVNPTNVMGATKRVCEMIVQMRAQQAGNKTQFVITRFGNVLGSNGSVIPIFRKQIEEGGPITVTHPEVRRFFMTIPEACQLVLEAGFMGRGGEIFVFDMGKPIKIIDLAHHMIKLSGLVPDEDIKVVFTGLRPGEKLYEELLTQKENTIPTHHPKIKIAQIESFGNKNLLTKINSHLSNIYNLSKQEIVEILKELVPEYKSYSDASYEIPNYSELPQTNNILKNNR
jgi:FlaA1/EpsC-like NDP-sugar epimerase